MPNLKAIVKTLSAIILLVLCLATNSWAKNSKNITKELWHDLSKSEVSKIKKFVSHLENSALDKAYKISQEIKEIEKEKYSNSSNFHEAMFNMILWKKYSDSSEENLKKIPFSDISRFVNDNPYFPNIDKLKLNTEKVAIYSDVPYKESVFYFSQNPAISKESKIYLAQSKISHVLQNPSSQENLSNNQKEIRKSISDIWINENFSSEEEEEFLEKYSNQLSGEDHFKRVNRLMWDDRITHSKRIFSLISQDERNLFEAIIKLRKMPRYIDKIILSVPRKYRSNELLLYRRALWYRSKDRLEDLFEVMVRLPKKSEFSDRWYSLRRLYARELLKEERYKLAYKLISNHGLEPNHSKYWEAEWTSGWIALRFLDKAKLSYIHFQNLYQNVKQPVTLARATYWLAMASEGMDEKSQALSWYKQASKYPTFFYGQLAIHKRRLLDPIGSQNDIILPEDPDISGRDLIAISDSKAAQIAYLFALGGNKKNAEEIFESIVENAPTDGQVAVIMKIINKIGDRTLDAKISKVAAKKNVFFIKDKFQIVKEVANDEHAPLVHAIIKQESGFAPSALSKVGAIGFMQLMPGTARLVAKEIGIRYSKRKLARDMKYNVRLGSHYIKKLINRFDGSEMLAIASYNAGPNNTQRWINEFYDPRQTNDINKVVDWIELITYSETRNYVQRIMENLIVYKYLMSRANYDQVK